MPSSEKTVKPCVKCGRQNRYESGKNIGRCIFCKSARDKRIRDLDTTRLKEIKRRAIARGISWELNDGDVLEILHGDCVYCGDRAVGLDRVDSDIGYREDNIVGCCGWCNNAKSDCGAMEFLLRCEKVYNKNRINSQIIKHKHARIGDWIYGQRRIKLLRRGT